MQKLSSFVKSAVRDVKGTTYTAAQNTVREASSNSSSLPTHAQLQEIVRLASIGSNNFALMSEVLWRRINDRHYPLHVLKGLIILHTCLEQGTNKHMFFDQAEARIREIEDLRNYQSGSIQTAATDVEVRGVATRIFKFLKDKEEEKKKEEQVVLDAAEKDKKKKKKHKKLKHKYSKKKLSLSVPVDTRARSRSVDNSPLSPGTPDKGHALPKLTKQDSLRAPPAAGRSRRKSLPGPSEDKPKKAVNPLDLDLFAQAIADVDKPKSTSDNIFEPSVSKKASSPQPIFSPSAADPFSPSANTGFTDENPFGPIDAGAAAAEIDPFAPDPVDTKHDFGPSLLDDENPFGPVAPAAAQASAAPADNIANLLGDFHSEQFDSLESKSGGVNRQDALLETFQKARYTKPAAASTAAASSPADADNPFDMLAAQAAPSPVAGQPKPKPKPRPKPVQKPKRVLPPVSKAHMSEFGAYARLFNVLLKDVAGLEAYLPLAEDGSDMLLKLEDGVLLAKFINVIRPGTIDLRVLNLKVTTKELFIQNSNLVLSAAQSLGVRTGVKTLSAKYPLRVLGVLSQLVKLELLANISVRVHPELVVMANDDQGNVNHVMLGELLEAPPQDLMLSWVKYHLRRAGQGTASIDLKDSMIYGHVINSVIKGSPAECNFPPPIDLSQLAAEKDLHKRASIILEKARAMGVHMSLLPQDIVLGNPRLNLALTAALFNCSTGFPVATQEEKAMVEKAGRLTDDVGDSREERAFRMWMNSLGVPKVNINSLYKDTKDGLVLLRLVDHIEPGLVNWGKVEKNPTNRFKKVANCGYVIELGHKLGFHLVNVSGVDIVDGSQKMLLAFTWQLMRHHSLKVLAAQKKRFKTDHPQDKDIIQWANNTVLVGYRTAQKQGSPPKLQTLHDGHLSSSLFLLDLLAAINPGVIDWSLVHSNPSSAAEKKENASYVVSVARKLGAVIFCLPEDIVEVKSKMILTLLAAIMAVA